jgi:nuclear receptor co-repressor 1
VDQRGYPIVRSDAELKEIMYELCEQEAGPSRNRKTHAVIPPMLTDEQDRRVRFISKNGLINDPMTLYRDSRFVSVWSEEEKEIFRDK